MTTIETEPTSNEQTSEPKRKNSEFWRKTLHMFPGFLPFWLITLPGADPLETHSLIFVTVITLVLTMTYVALHKVVKRQNESDFLLTALSYPVIVLASLWLFPAQMEFACVVVVILAFGDGSAFIGGKMWGRKKLPWNRDKSWAGLFSFLAIAGPASTYLIYHVSANPSISLLSAVLCAGFATLLAAVAESVDTKLTDNLRVGLAAICGVAGMYFLLANTVGLSI